MIPVCAYSLQMVPAEKSWQVGSAELSINICNKHTKTCNENTIHHPFSQTEAINYHGTSKINLTYKPHHYLSISHFLNGTRQICYYFLPFLSISIDREIGWGWHKEIVLLYIQGVFTVYYYYGEEMLLAVVCFGWCDVIGWSYSGLNACKEYKKADRDPVKSE